MLQFKSHTVDDIAVADFLVPALCDGPALEYTSERLHGMIGAARCKNLIVDLSRVMFVASSTLGLLVGLRQAVQSNGGSFVICGLRKQVQQVFRLSGLDRYLTLLATQDEALTAIRTASPQLGSLPCR